MTDHQPHPGRLTGANHFPAVGHGGRHGLFAKYVLTPPGRRGGDLLVSEVGTGDDHRVDVRFRQEFFMIVEPGQLQAGVLGEIGPPGLAGVADRHQLGELIDVWGEMRPEIARADQPDAKSLFRHRY